MILLNLLFEFAQNQIRKSINIKISIATIVKMEEFMDVDTNTVGLKAKSKKELYDMLSGPNGVYMPPLKDCHYKFIRQL